MTFACKLGATTPNAINLVVFQKLFGLLENINSRKNIINFYRQVCVRWNGFV